jgi:O-antigen/teichoic acid export membrane protein
MTRLDWVEPPLPASRRAAERETTPEEARPFARPVYEARAASVQGGVVSVGSQALRLVIRTASMMVLARLLTAEDFGLQGMVVVMTGFLALFRDAGLSAVTVQRDDVSHDQVSTLFWINVTVGIVLAAVLALAAPMVAAFYRDARLTPICLVSACAFLIHGFSIQHYALLQRQMRFVTLGVLEIAAVAVAAAVGVGMALLGYGYWALVAMAMAAPLVTAIGCWASMPWVPGAPRRTRGMRSMLSMGCTLTLDSVVVYLGGNAEKILLGRYWGAEALGVYGRAYQLISLPADLLTSGVATVALPLLARLQTDPERLQRTFLKGYSVVVALTIPTTVSCALFADDIVEIMLGPRWNQAVPVFRLMVPSILALALINPLAWLLISSGRARRSLNIAFLITPLSIAAAALGLRFGPKGVAVAMSTTMTLLTVPVIIWARAGTTMTGRDVWNALRGPLVAGSLAAVVGFGASITLATLPTVLHVMLGAALIYGVYFLVLLIPLKQAALYRELARGIGWRSPERES